MQSHLPHAQDPAEGSREIIDRTPGTGEDVYPVCGSRGQINGKPCPSCNGTGLALRARFGELEPSMRRTPPSPRMLATTRGRFRAVANFVKDPAWALLLVFPNAS